MHKRSLALYNPRMSGHRTFRHFTTWLAMGAVLLGTLLPTLSHAAARWASPTGWVAICTSTGMVWMHAHSGELTDAPPASPTVSAQVGCTWCLLQGGSGGLPPVESLTLSVMPGSSIAPVLRLAGPERHPVWPSSLSRAPPQLT